MTAHLPTLLTRLTLITGIMAATASHAAPEQAAVKKQVDAAVAPVMKKHNIAGMAVGVIAQDKTYLFNYGVASRQTASAVTSSTLFELGSISKTFTATLASYAQVKGYLKLSDTVESYLPKMQKTEFGSVSLMQLGTHTPGGFPLQVPEQIGNNVQLMSYLQQWKPPFEKGTKRTYTNPGIGMLGLITAKAMGQDFIPLMEKQLYAGLGLSNTYIDIPDQQVNNYAQGYTSQDTPTRVSKGVLWAEAYGAKSTSADMVRFLKINMHMADVDEQLQKAVTNTHTGYFQTAAMTQDLIWEQYPYPVTLASLQHGNSADFALSPQPVKALTPPMAPRDDVWINKTGSTNGFGAYVAFVPKRKIGIVILANKNYPNADRLAIAYQILGGL
ncbi:class C beta-lactamase [Advenella mimigardefordensis]|uniref:Beta-lactamase n=1 Tax=Advenella mimigardefordensis (strain DSM 17166 / LMG 22922 / DPN7) TaxID=1247726 RepID=W0PGB9_ADVMD|nr:beta-lactamase [Advenella mimigardefordensis DPN7]